MKELYRPQAQHAHKHQGKMLLFFCFQRPHRNGPCDIGGALIILAAGVNQIQAPWLQRYVGLLGCRVVAHGPMCSVCGYGSEAGTDASFLLLTQVFHVFTYAELIHGYLPYVFLQPVNEFCHSHSVFDMGFFLIFNLHIVLNTLHQRSRIHFVYYFIGTVKQPIDGIVYPAFLQQYLLIPETFYHVVHFIIWTYGNSNPFQVFPGGRVIRVIQIWICLSIYHILIDKQIQLVHGEDYIGQHNRIIKDIIPTDI